MSKERVLILDKEQIDRKLHRMAYELWEHNCDETSITMIGIESGGIILAENLAKMLREISPLEVKVTPISINKKNPLNHAIDVDHDLHGRSVVLVDDVANSGKTILYSLQSLLSYNLKKVRVAVLVDRKHKSFPISSDIVGHTLATTLQEHIEVEVNGNEIVAAYLQ